MGEHLIQKSRKSDIVIPENLSVSQLIFEALDQIPDKVVLTDAPSGRAYKAAQVKGLSIKFAKGLSSLGFVKGDCLSLFSPNLPEFLIAVLGCSYLGGVVSPANPLYTAEELTKQLNDSGATVIITVAPFLEKVKEASQNTKIKHFLVFGEAEGATSFASLLANDGDIPHAQIDTKKDLFALPYSSGTTGVSKGVMLSHYNIVANLNQFHDPEYVDFNENDNILGVLPFFHIYGLVVISLYGLFAKSHIITMPKFDPPEFLKAIQSYKLSILMVVPPIVLFLAKHPIVSNFDLSSVRKVLCGAAPLGKEMTEAVCERLKITDVRQGFGMTELSPVTHVTPDTNPKHGSVGLLIPNTLCKVVDVETNEILGHNKDGELCIKGPQVMLGYLNNQQATKTTIDEEGWLHTGDIGHYDEEGFFFIVDRLKELIKYKGFQVPPAELEALLNTHPSVADVAVIGIPDDEAGELPKAFIVKKAGATVTEEELAHFVEKHVAPHKKLRGGIEFVTEIPKSASGKILRRLLRKH